ncbi:MAG: hypothetical protein HEQ37_18760 [Acidovorax sp.]|nr:hypothetical protein [Acidovorax sp.]
MRGTYSHEFSTDWNLIAFRVAMRDVVIDLDSWESLTASLPHAVWTTDGNRAGLVPILRTPEHGRMMAARLIAGATDQQEVGYRDGDRFNLTRKNLVLSDTSRKVYRRVPLPVLVQPGATGTA